MTLTKLCTPWRFACAAVLALAGLAYIPSLQGGFIWDDKVIMDGSAIGGGDSLLHCFTRPFLDNYYRPLVSASFYLERPFSRVTPFFYHQTNILIHVLTTAALLGLFGDAFRSRRASLFGAALFAVQPVQNSAVAWIGGRTDSLCALSMALFAWMLVRAARTDGKPRAAYSCAAVVAYALAVFTKEQMLPALVLVPLAFRCFSRRPGDRGVALLLKRSVPFVAVAAAFVLALAVCVKTPGTGREGGWYIVGSLLRTAAYYPLLLFAPTTRWMHTMSLGMFVDAGTWAVLGGLAAVGLAGWLYVRWLNSAPEAAWFLAFTGAALVMVSNVIPVPSMMVTPYRAAVAGIGAAALLGWALDRWMGTARPRKLAALASRPAVLAFGAMLVWYGRLTWWGAGQWGDDLTIARTFVDADPHSIWARYNLSSALLNRHRRDEAIAQLERLLDSLFGSGAWRTTETAVAAVRTRPALLPGVHEIQGTRSSSEEMLAQTFAQLGGARLDATGARDAKPLLQTALAFDRTNPQANEGMGEIAATAGDYEGAIAWFRRALRKDPSLDRALKRLGDSYEALGRWEEARGVYSAWVCRQPWLPQPYLALASAQTRLGDWSGAEKTLELARRNAVKRKEVPQMLADVRGRRLPPLDLP